MKKLMTMLFFLIVVFTVSCSSRESLKQPKSDAHTSAPPIYIKSLDMTFVYIPPGTFTMGSPADEPGRRDTEKQHSVTLTQGFYLQTTEVTQAQWQAVMGDNPSDFTLGDDYPVGRVSWEDVQQFITKLNGMSDERSYRLPTEAEWEYAARAGTQTAYYTGNSEADLAQAGWHSANSGYQPHPVGQKKPNAFGLYDMHGNVYEWVEDDWHADYTGAPDNGKAWTDNPRGLYRVLRGGCWFYGARRCRSASRYGGEQDLRQAIMGFRLALPPDQPGKQDGK